MKTAVTAAKIVLHIVKLKFLLVELCNSAEKNLAFTHCKFCLRDENNSLHLRKPVLFSF